MRSFVILVPLDVFVPPMNFRAIAGSECVRAVFRLLWLVVGSALADCGHDGLIPVTRRMNSTTNAVAVAGE
jgi:hypothetical protein